MTSSTLLAFFSPGPMELLIVAVIVLLLFGSRLPGVMRSLGSSIVEFKKGINEGDESSQKAENQQAEKPEN